MIKKNLKRFFFILTKLSIDSILQMVMQMNDKFQSTKDDVEQFLDTINTITNSPKFNTSCDFDLLIKNEANDKFSTMNTILSLNYDKNDVLNEIRKLKVEDYVETGIDRKDANLPYLYIFNKNIQGKDIYIKVKIRSVMNHKIFCISFHYAKYKVTFFPYK